MFFLVIQVLGYGTMHSQPRRGVTGIVSAVRSHLWIIRGNSCLLGKRAMQMFQFLYKTEHQMGIGNLDGVVRFGAFKMNIGFVGSRTYVRKTTNLC